MEKQYQHFMNLIEEKSELSKPEAEAAIGWLVNVIILIDAFKQNFLMKLLNPSLLDALKTSQSLTS